MREKLLEILKLNRNNAITVDEMYLKMFHSEKEEKLYNSLCEELENLINEKQVYCTNSKKGLYILNPFREGVCFVKKSKDMFVECGDEVFKVSKNLVGANDKDKVLIRVTDYNACLCSIKEIIERHGIIAEVKTIKKKRYAVVGKTMYEIDVDNSIVDGMLIGIKIDKTKKGKYFKATLDTVIGHKNAPKIDEIEIIYDNGGMHGFSPETKDEVKNIQSQVYDSDIENRRDLRQDVIFTIDGADTKDIDDAIGLKILSNGNYELGVHIADVTHYVKENTSIDRDARFKGTSIYMPGVVEPMYPVELSNGICSLNEGVDRLALSVIMEFNNNGDLINFDIFKSVINSKKKMTYGAVNKILLENIIEPGYEEYVDTLKNMEKLASILRNMRIRRGLLDFDSSEIKINVDDKGKVLDIGKRIQSVGENLIEDFMLAANECVATYIYNMGITSIYRIHDYPNYERLIKTVNIIKSYGEKLDVKLSMRDPKVIQNLLKALKDSSNYDIYSNMILRCMAKAYYSNNNEGHFGIGIDSRKNEAYTHFTSPIRRYPDTTVHRVLSNILDKNIESISSDFYKNNIIDIAVHSSKMEKVADNCEREANKMKMAEYMENFIGEEFTGKISGFTFNGMFVMLDNLVEGRIDFSCMDDYYVYNEDLEIVVGERYKKIYRLGDKIRVKLVKASKCERIIDFKLAGNNKKKKVEIFKKHNKPKK